MAIEHSPSQNDSVLVELDKLALPTGSFMVMGSGILEALGIRKAHDVDLVVSEEVFAQLSNDGWESKIASDGHRGIEKGLIEAYKDWTDDDGTLKTLSEILVDAQWVNGIPFNSLTKLALYKVRRGQAKDFNDLVSINEYLENSQ